jgi:hypothetical protein
MSPLTRSPQIVNVPAGSEAMVLDIAKFHRTCAILPDHKRWFVLQGPDGFSIEHTCPFGVSSSSSNAGSIGGAVVQIWKAKGVSPICRYEDDFSVFRFPISPSTDSTAPASSYVYAYDRSSALDLIRPTGTPWHPDKGQDFARTFTYIGFLWDIDRRTVSLPAAKRLKFLRCMRIFLQCFSANRCRIHDVMKIHGSLCHIAFVFPLGRSRLPALSNLIAPFQGNTYAERHPTHHALPELRWWEETLRNPSAPRQLLPRGLLVDLGLYVDASTSWGIGIKLGDSWDTWKGIGAWSSQEHHIGWLKAIALELIVYAIEERGLRNSHLLVHSDNKGVIGAFDKGRSRNDAINLSIRRSCLILATRNLTLELRYIESDKNPADPISRGVLGSHSSFPLPDDLATYFLHV